MATAGTIVVELQANTAQFQQEMGKASTGLKTITRESGNSERALSHFAAKGLGEVIPAAQGAEFAIGRLIDNALRGAGALRTLGAAGAVIGGSLLVAAGVQRLQEEIKNWLALGETISQTTERLKTEAEEQEKFAQRRKAAVSLLINLEGQLAQARAESSAAALKAQGDEPGAAGAALEGQLAAIAQEKQLRDRNITEVARDAAERQRLEVDSTLIANAKRLAANENYNAAIRKLQEDSTAKAIDQFATETNAMIESLKRRLSLKKSIEDEASAAAQRQGLGDIFAPFREQDNTRQDIEKIALGLGELATAGKDVTGIIGALDQQFQERGFIGFSLAVAQASEKVKQLGIDSASLDTSFGALSARLSSLPIGISAALPQVASLVQSFDAITISANRAQGAVQALAAAIAVEGGTPAPQVTQPVDLGFQP